MIAEDDLDFQVDFIDHDDEFTGLADQLPDEFSTSDILCDNCILPVHGLDSFIIAEELPESKILRNDCVLLADEFPSNRDNNDNISEWNYRKRSENLTFVLNKIAIFQKRTKKKLYRKVLDLQI